MPEENVPIDIAAAVKYLDTNWFEGGSKPWWCGGISLEKYLQTRAMFAYVPFEVKTSAKALRQFKKDVKAYLVPGAKRGKRKSPGRNCTGAYQINLCTRSCRGSCLSYEDSSSSHKTSGCA